MRTDERLPVVVLWHMHQPDYRDALSGEYRLPWTLLHAIKDYTDMAAHLEENPHARAVVNFTPVLIEQLRELSASLDAHLTHGALLPDPVLAVLADEDLPEGESARAALMGALLRAHATHLIGRYPRFAELARWARELIDAGRAVHASDTFLRDLGCWYYLAWMGETIKRGDERIEKLLAHEGSFNSAQRRVLLQVIAEQLQTLLPRYRQLHESGQVEIAISPYAHPILPLLLDFNAAREAQPDAPLPVAAAYPGGAERVQWHLQRAVRVLKDCFGGEPQGCWPSEGALSDGALDAIARHGFRWVASGGTVLHGTLHAQSRSAGEVPECQPYAHPGGAPPGRPLRCVFRHDGVSDLIGFTYSRWHGDDAVANLVGEVERIVEQAYSRPHGQRLLLIALDGENAWEHYPFNGYYFLRGLYAALATHPRLKLCLMSEALAAPAATPADSVAAGTATAPAPSDDGVVPLAPLGRVRAGSWVNGTLATWIGDADKNRGWDLLVDAKRAVDEALASGRFDDTQHERILLQLAHCESSDWFWWFGDYNPAESVRDFDELFRHQLASLYQLIGKTPPATLAQRISVGRGDPEGGGVMRRAQQ
jgi:alpha-amylase/alpha-mannosidase (GH57 family)